MSEIASAEFPALGTSARVAIRGGDAPRAAALLAEELDAIDRACSRFRDDSDLTAVNARAGEAVPVAPLFIEAVHVALRAGRLTDGLVDPTVGQAMRILGYDRDFQSIDRDGPPRRVQVQRIPGWQVVEIDPAHGTVRVPKGVALDLGATAKALAADRAAARLAHELSCGVLVSLGGDIAVAGEAPPDGWPVRVIDDHSRPDARPGETVALTTGGLATSSTVARSWRAGDERRHHVVDPATGRSAIGPYRTVTVAAGTCVDANIATTASIVLGADAPEWLTHHGFPARLVTNDGQVERTTGWPLAQDAA